MPNRHGICAETEINIAGHHRMTGNNQMETQRVIRHLVVAVFGLVAMIGCGETGTAPSHSDSQPPLEPAVAAAPLEDAPLTISVSTVGTFAEGHSWYLSVDSTGQAELTIDTFPDRTHTRFQVPKEQLAEFRTALAEVRFFELNGEYGEQVPDGSETSVTVSTGQQTNTVKVHYLMNWVRTDKARLREPSRAVRLVVLVRGWFDAAEAVDLRKYDKMVLAAAKE